MLFTPTLKLPLLSFRVNVTMKEMRPVTKLLPDGKIALCLLVFRSFSLQTQMLKYRFKCPDN